MLWSVLAKDIAYRLKNVSVLFFTHPLISNSKPLAISFNFYVAIWISLMGQFRKLLQMADFSFF